MTFRDIELLSAYLDGQLSPSESQRLESRVSSDPNLRAVLDDLREARSLLRQLPARKAPRNFTLTRQMVGLKPPVPRVYPAFRFATALAALLLFATFAINALSPSVTMRAAAPAPAAACEACGGGAPELESQSTELFAATEAPTEAPAATEAPVEPTFTMLPTETVPPAADSANQAVAVTPELKQEPTEEATVLREADTQQAQVPSQALIPVAWQTVLAILAILSGLAAFLIRRAAAQKWK
ncbi:MAG: hypothetical protein AB1649_12485 [Chloroflexota bacterium]